jgi:hypothetical protein
METRERTDWTPELEKIFPSDFLPQLVSFLDLVPSLRPLFPKLIQVRLVVDANRVRAELYWRLRKRRDVSHRTALHEAIIAGVIVPYVPHYLNQEIEEDYEEIAAQTRRPVSDVRCEWKEFKKHLVFYAPKGRPLAGEIYADPDDFPYLAAWRELDARAIYTTDLHLRRMGAPVISVLIDTRLRDYARSSAVQMAVGFGSSVSVMAGVQSLQGLYRLLTKLLASFRRLSPAAQLAIVGGATICVLHPKSRAKMKEIWNSWKSSPLTLVLCDALLEFAAQYAKADATVKENYEALQAELPKGRKRPLLHHARSVCAEAGCPLNLEEMERRIRRGGYKSQSQNFRGYLRRVLLAEGGFSEVSPGCWALKAAHQVT